MLVTTVVTDKSVALASGREIHLWPPEPAEAIRRLLEDAEGDSELPPWPQR